MVISLGCQKLHQELFVTHQTLNDESQQRPQRSSGSGGGSHIGRWLALACSTCAPDMKSSEDGCRGKEDPRLKTRKGTLVSQTILSKLMQARRDSPAGRPGGREHVPFEGPKYRASI